MTTQRGPEWAHIAYGKGRLPLRLDPAKARWTVLTPRAEQGLAYPGGAFKTAAANPIGARPLRGLAGPAERVVIVTCDGTRPVPNRQLIPWIIGELGVPADNVTVLVGTGSHRPNTPDEIVAMFGAEIARSVRIVNHDSFNRAQNVPVGTVPGLGEVQLAREYVEADKRVVVGFIEPHFFAGFSGGPKGIAPGVASIETIKKLHSFTIIGHPNSTYGVTDANPTQEAVRAAVALCPPDFMVNVTLNPAKEITAFFLGHYLKAHEAGCAHVKDCAMVPVARRFPVVVTSNSGYPLDQNLYQSVKALSVAARIVEDGGTIFLVSECSDGLPAHGNFGSFFAGGIAPAALLEQLRSQENARLDQWQVQTLANVLVRCQVAVHSRLDSEQVKACCMTPVSDLQQALDAHLEGLGGHPEAVALPDGPLSVPYLT